MMNREAELLQITTEESSEIIQAISKGIRFGWDIEYKGQTNREHLNEEIGDLVAMVKLLIDDGFLDEEQISAAAERKLDKLKTWSSLTI